MIKILCLILLICITPASPQTKYFIYFKDKGIASEQLLKSGSDRFIIASELLSERSIERRKKAMGEHDYLTFDDLPVNSDYVSILKNNGIKVIHELRWFNSVSVYLDDNQREIISSFPFVEKVEPVRKLVYRDPGSDFESPGMQSYKDNLNTDYGQSFDQLNISGIPRVHSRGITGENVIIGFLDTGYNWKLHEALKDVNVIAEYDFIFGDENTANEQEDHPNQDFHGTLVFSVTAGYKPGTLIGASYGSAFLLSKTEDIRSERNIEEDNYAAALIWMESFGVDITSSSLGYSQFDEGQNSYSYSDMNGRTTIVTKAVELAFERGVVTITSAGNEGSTAWRHITAPADGINIISVGAVDQDKNIAQFSSRGPTFDGRIKPEVVARGVGVYGASNNGSGSYTFGSGTSLSAPIAAGVAGLLLSAHPYLTNYQVRSIFLETSSNSKNPNNDIGYGLLNAADAISYPVLQKVNEKFVIHKYFINNGTLNSTSLKMFYSTDGENFIELAAFSGQSEKFSFQLPAMSSDKVVQFYFTYKDSALNDKREPVSDYYSFQYGQLLVYHNFPVQVIPVEYVLSQNYPNPFNTGTRINFIAAKDSRARLLIYNALGEQIRSLYDGTTDSGVNTVYWDGKNDSGVVAASGVYYYVLNLNGTAYARKMVLLK